MNKRRLRFLWSIHLPRKAPRPVVSAGNKVQPWVRLFSMTANIRRKFFYPPDKVKETKQHRKKPFRKPRTDLFSLMRPESDSRKRRITLFTDSDTAAGKQHKRHARITIPATPDPSLEPNDQGPPLRENKPAKRGTWKTCSRHEPSRQDSKGTHATAVRKAACGHAENRQRFMNFTTDPSAYRTM